MANNPEKPKLTPYLTVKGAAEAIDFYCTVFGATEVSRLTDPNDGRIGHAELLFGTTSMMIADEYAEAGALGPLAFDGAPVKLHLSVTNVDETFAKAIQHGAQEVRAVADQFHGHRGGVLTDPFGHSWHIDTQTEVITIEEMQRRWNDAGSD